MAEAVGLRNGETLELSVIDDPDDPRADDLLRFLVHKGQPWQYHLDEWRAGRIRRLETRFYVGTIGGEIAGNIMTLEWRGIGLMGHVFTRPDHRRKGICDVLMDYHEEDFRRRDGIVLYLNTGFESHPWHIYRAHGYVPVPERHGSMWWAPGAWEPDLIYGSIERPEVVAPAWHHWPSANIYTHVDLGRIVRNVAYGIYGISPSEGQFVALMRDLGVGKDVQARAVETRDGHLCGLATLAPERRWGGRASTWVFDLCVHPGATGVVPEIMGAIDWPDAHVLAYAAETDDASIDLLAESGFHPHSHVERFFDGGTGLVVMDRDAGA